jgi:gluconate kinase
MQQFLCFAKVFPLQKKKKTYIKCSTLFKKKRQREKIDKGKHIYIYIYICQKCHVKGSESKITSTHNFFFLDSIEL